MPTQANPVPQPMLIFIPDIGGFSRFVANTEIEHSQHIIEELLEILINANELGMQVSEIEGDAILFYKEGNIASLSKLLAQVETMYLKFHSRLKMYESNRICQCGACSTANNLKLKFVITYGEVGFNVIKDHVKLFGKEVIIAHRLLKNAVPHIEYALFTNAAITDQKETIELKSTGWEQLEHGSEEYDVGTIEYQYLNLGPLSRNVPLPKIESYGLKGAKTMVLESEFVINAPINMVFNVLSDFSIRHYWSSKIKDSDHLNSKISRNGSSHRCLINDDKNDPYFIAHDFSSTKNSIVFNETDANVGISIVYELEVMEASKTILKTHAFLQGRFIKPIIFKLFFKKKFVENVKESNSKMNEYCKKLLLEGQSPNNQIILK